MITTLAVAGYRSLREVVVPLGPLTLVTGANGVGKTSLHRALGLLHVAAMGGLAAAVAREGGLDSLLWAGPSTQPRQQGTPRRRRTVPSGTVQLGFATDDLGYCLDLGLAGTTHWAAGRPGLFGRDPDFKREVIWAGPEPRPSAVFADRRGPLLRTREPDADWQVVTTDVPGGESMLTQPVDPRHAPEILTVRDAIRRWRFFDAVRTDPDAPARRAEVGTRTPLLSADGHDLASAWQTIREAGFDHDLDCAVDDAFPGASVDVVEREGLLHLLMMQPGLHRPLKVSELSDGTLRYLLLTAALTAPRPAPLLVFNEPEASLHVDLLPALGRRLVEASRRTQVWVVSHAPPLVEALAAADGVVTLALEKEDGETVVVGQSLLDRPRWTWLER